MKWKYTLDVSDVWAGAGSIDKDALSKARQEVTTAVEVFLIANRLNGEADIDEIVEEMRDAADAEDMDWFNSCWNAFYDFADAYRIWVKTQ